MLATIALLLIQLFHSACAYNVHSGFNYGAFWSTGDKPKHKSDYVKAFQTAYALNTSVAFDSARLFTCRQPGTTDKWIEAFDAAVDTHTYLLLGFYLSEVRPSARKPGQTYETNEQMLHNELRALDGALANYGPKLADLIIGLSVGNEDMEQWYAGRETGVPENVIAANIETVRGVINGGPAFGDAYPAISKYLKDKPIGHTDTVPHAAKVKNVDFAGMNAYPYWSGDPPARMQESYFGSLDVTRKAMPGKEIWLTEVGWPFRDSASAKAAQGVANRQTLQKYWDGIGCAVFGKYTIFWFELIQDTLPDQPDWAILDSVERNVPPRIDVSCGRGRSVWAHRRELPASKVSAASQVSISQDPNPSHTSPAPSVPASEASTFLAYSLDSSHALANRSTKHITITSTITEVSKPNCHHGSDHTGNITTTNSIPYPTSPLPPANTSMIISAPANSSTARPTVWVTVPTGCITISFDANGQRITMSNPPVDGKCPIPTYVPPSNVNGTTPCLITPVLSSDHTTAVSAYPSNATVISQSPVPTPTSTATVIGATTCVTVSDDGKGGAVTVASNLPTNGSCAAPTYAPPKSSKVRITVVVSPSPVTEDGAESAGAASSK